MNWIKYKALPATEAIKHNNHLCTSLELLWQALHQMYNSTTNRQVTPSILNEIPTSLAIEWPPLSHEELREAIAKCSNSSAPGPDHISWCTLKLLVKDQVCLSHITHLANTCINLSHWPNHFKVSTLVIIPKP